LILVTPTNTSLQRATVLKLVSIIVFIAKSVLIALNSKGKQMYYLVLSVVLLKISRGCLNQTVSNIVKCVL